MAKVKLVTTKSNRFGQSIMVGEGVGKVDIDENGQATVDSEHVEVLLARGFEKMNAAQAQAAAKEAAAVAAAAAKEADELAAAEAAEAEGKEPEAKESEVGSETDEGDTSESSDSTEEGDGDEGDGDSEEKLDFSEATYTQLKNVADAMGYPKNEWTQIRSKAGMIEYLEGKAK